MAGKITVNITASWDDRKEHDSVRLPLSWLKFKVYYKRKVGAHSLAEGYLDDKGHATVSGNKRSAWYYDDAGKIVVRLYTETKDLKVVDDNKRHTFYHQIVVPYKKNESVQNINIILFVNTDDDTENRCIIASLTQYGANFVREAYKMEPGKVFIEYGDTCGCGFQAYADGDGKAIHLSRSKKQSYRTFFHEYAHCLQHWIWPQKRPNTSSNHSVNCDNTVTETKLGGLSLAFTEGHANYFADRVIDYYGSVLRKLIGYEDENKVGDMELEENSMAHYERGEGNELAIASILHDISDKNQEESLEGWIDLKNSDFINSLETKDRLNFPDYNLGEVFKKMPNPIFYDFAKTFVEYASPLSESFKFLLSIHAFAPYLIKTEKTDEKKNTIELSWIPGGMETSFYYDEDGKFVTESKPTKTYQNEFDVTIYDRNKNKVLGSKKVKEKPYTFDFTKLKKLRDSGHNHFLVKVKGRNTQEYVTEYETPYYCAFFNSYVDDDKLVIIPASSFTMNNAYETATVNAGDMKFDILHREGNSVDVLRGALKLQPNQPLEIRNISQEFNNIEIIFNKDDYKEGELEVLAWTSMKTTRFNYLNIKRPLAAFICNPNVSKGFDNFSITLDSNNFNQCIYIERIILSNLEIKDYKYGEKADGPLDMGPYDGGIRGSMSFTPDNPFKPIDPPQPKVQDIPDPKGPVVNSNKIKQMVTKVSKVDAAKKLKKR